MRIAFVLFDGMTSMDFVGFYEAITWLSILKVKENVSWSFCANKLEVTDDRGMTIKVDQVLHHLADYDLIFIPGGLSTRSLRYDEHFMNWIRTSETVPYKVSVCTGALLLGAAGFLVGRQATTNSAAYDLLEPYCSRVIKARVVRDGQIITGGGVTASLDVGLYTVEWLTNAEVARQVQGKLAYPYYRAGILEDVYMPIDDEDAGF